MTRVTRRRPRRAARGRVYGLPVEDTGAPDPGRLQRMLEVPVNLPGQIQDGTADGKREWSGPIGGLAWDFRVDPEHPNKSYARRPQGFQTFARLAREREDREPVPEPFADDLQTISRPVGIQLGRDHHRLEMPDPFVLDVIRQLADQFGMRLGQPVEHRQGRFRHIIAAQVDHQAAPHPPIGSRWAPTARRTPARSAAGQPIARVRPATS